MLKDEVRTGAYLEAIESSEAGGNVEIPVNFACLFIDFHGLHPKNHLKPRVF